MAQRERNAVSEFFAKLAQAIGEATNGAVADVRHKWEEAWFGREVTPEFIGTMAESLGWDARTTHDMKTSWDALCADLAKQCGHELSPEHEQDLER